MSTCRQIDIGAYRPIGSRTLSLEDDIFGGLGLGLAYLFFVGPKSVPIGQSNKLKTDSYWQLYNMEMSKWINLQLWKVPIFSGWTWTCKNLDKHGQESVSTAI